MTKPERTEEFRIPGTQGSERMARDRAASFATEMGLESDRVEDVKTAVNEACLNAIEHGGSGTSPEEIVLRLTGTKTILSIAISNKGKGFVPPVCKPDIREKIEGRDRPRGWGISMIRELADSVEFDSKNGVTTITMRFVL